MRKVYAHSIRSTRRNRVLEIRHKVNTKIEETLDRMNDWLYKFI